MTENKNTVFDKSKKIIISPEEKATKNVQELKSFIQQLPSQITTLTHQIQELENKKTTLQKEVQNRNDIAKIQRIQLVQNYLVANLKMIQSHVDENLFVTRCKQMYDYFNQLPVAERNEKSILESYYSIFDVNSVTPIILPKDFCEKCHRPLRLIRKQAMWLCIGCANLTEHLTPLTVATSWLKTGSNHTNDQPENKRIKSVLTKLSQFKTGGQHVPPEIILEVKQRLRDFDHTGNAIALPTPVSDVLEKLGHTVYKPCAQKIANIINGVEVCELTDDQINEIISRLRVIQMVFSLLQGGIERLHFYTNFFVNQICLLKGWNAAAEAFPPQRTKRISREQMNMWRMLMNYVKLIDTKHSW